VEARTIENEARINKEKQKERIRKRYGVRIDPDNYRFIPARKVPDFYDETIHQDVGIYVRVSTDDVRQTTSYELQKKYYEEYVNRHPNWTLVHIYADEGISGTSLKHRDEFNRMIADCKAGKITRIITKSVSRFARNVEDFVGTVRMLAELKPHVGVYFESEAIYSLNDESQMALTFQATMAEEESHTRSRSMEASLQMRLNHGIPLTPKLYGYTHDENGELIINPDEAPTVKLMFFMYLYGYSCQQIADTLAELGRRSYYGRLHWNASTVLQVLRNERHCGDVLTRKTYTESYRTHKVVKNRGDRGQSWYYNHHKGIVSRDDFNAVQKLLDNARYGNKSILPELRVIETGVLHGFVTINSRWSGFTADDYRNASRSVYEIDDNQEVIMPAEDEYQIEVEEGEFDLRGFEVARSEFFENSHGFFALLSKKCIKFSSACVNRFGKNNYVELLINPTENKFAVRSSTKDNRNAVPISKLYDNKTKPREIPITAFGETLFELLQWNMKNKYRVSGQLFEEDGHQTFIFERNDGEILLHPDTVRADVTMETERVKPLLGTKNLIRAVPSEWANSFGKPYYVHEQSYETLANMKKEEWNLRVKGQLFETGTSFKVTGFDELRTYITEQLGSVTPKEVNHE